MLLRLGRERRGYQGRGCHWGLSCPEQQGQEGLCRRETRGLLDRNLMCRGRQIVQCLSVIRSIYGTPRHGTFGPYSKIRINLIVVNVLCHILDLLVKLLRGLRRCTSGFSSHGCRERSCCSRRLSMLSLMRERFLRENGGAAEWSSRCSLQTSCCRPDGASRGEGGHCVR